MNNITKALLTVSLTLGLLAGCAQPNPHPMDMTTAIQNTKTKADHEALATHYEQAAHDAEVKVEEHKQLLAQYQEHSYLYGRQAQMVEEHCESLIHEYQQIAQANLQMAKLHRQIADEIK
jgi:hypothetical protein